jgi:hypothetical protein
MSFMVVNTGRVASQYFYINLKLQPDVIMPSRYQFDHVVKSFIKRRYKKPLKDFKRFRKKQLQQNPNSAFGIVFHSARRNLIYPLSSERNVDFLKACRDALELDTIFFPIRDPHAVFRSELNRQLARGAGDWVFPIGMNGWRKKWKLSDCDTLKNQPLMNNDFLGFLPENIDETDLKEPSKNFLLETAKIFSLYELFSNVFSTVKVFDYKYLFQSPESVLTAMGDAAGFSLSDLSLLKTRLNGLANRFMLYNSFTLVVDKQTETNWKEKGIPIGNENSIPQKISLKRIIKEKQNPFIRSCKFKFEIPKVIPVCEDWGKYERVALVQDEQLPSLKNSLGTEIAIGGHKDDIGNFYREELDEMVNIIHQEICPRFEINFKILIDYYKKNVYYNEVPKGQLYDQFQRISEKEFQKMNPILTASDFL